MSGTTPTHKLPYPTAGDPVYKGAEQIEALARAVDGKLSGSGGGGGTGAVAATPGTLALRDANGRTQVTDPSAAADAANRGWIEAQGYASETYVDQKIQEAEIGDGGGGEGSLTPESVTATGGSLALRDANGRTQVATPSANADATPKSYVDTNITNKGFITSAALSSYATKTYVDTAVGQVSVPSDVVRQPAVDALRAELFGGATRTRPAVAEIAVSSNFGVPATTDRLAQASWTPLVDTDNGTIISGTYGQTRYVVPVAGRYEITYQLLHTADNARAGGAMKVLVNGQNVLTDSIASQTATASLEGPTMHLKTEYVMNAGDQVRWGYWYSAAVTILAQGFGNAKSKIVIRWVGPR